MVLYKNLSGNSGVLAYSLEPGSILVRFNDGWEYLYTGISAGMQNIAQMKSLALNGQGLNSFINRVVRNKYASKRR